MKRDRFESLLERALSSIPETFLERIDNLTVQVEDWADPALLAELGFSDPEELLGFYSGWPLSERTHDYGGCLPDVITIYQQAIEAEASATGEPLLKIIRETLLHELAHYFGFSEEEMDAIEELWAKDRPDQVS